MLYRCVRKKVCVPEISSLQKHATEPSWTSLLLYKCSTPCRVTPCDGTCAAGEKYVFSGTLRFRFSGLVQDDASSICPRLRVKCRSQCLSTLPQSLSELAAHSWQ